ncbi:hypothetical protein C8F01DRAFT_1376553 [Mycena amicta]|nr:hypothetical protein C8F01DRAFT_1376553 [Mycena amicta]
MHALLTPNKQMRTFAISVGTKKSSPAFGCPTFDTMVRPAFAKWAKTELGSGSGDVTETSLAQIEDSKLITAVQALLPSASTEKLRAILDILHPTAPVTPAAFRAPKDLATDGDFSSSFAKTPNALPVTPVKDTAVLPPGSPKSRTPPPTPLVPPESPLSPPHSPPPAPPPKKARKRKAKAVVPDAQPVEVSPRRTCRSAPKTENPRKMVRETIIGEGGNRNGKWVSVAYMEGVQEENASDEGEDMTSDEDVEEDAMSSDEEPKSKKRKTNA